MRLFISLLCFLFTFNLIAQSNNEDPNKIESFYQKADSLNIYEDFSTSLKLNQAYIIYHLANENWKQYTKGNQLQINNLISLGQFNLAKDVCLKTLFNDKIILSDSIKEDLLNKLANTYNRLGDFQKALSTILEALTSAEKAYPPKHTRIALTNNNTGLGYKDLKLFEKALFHFKKSIEIYVINKEGNELGLARSYNNLGDLYLETGNPYLAIEYLNQSLQIFEQYPKSNQFNIAIVNLSLGMSYLRLKKISIAKSYTKKANDIALNILPPEHGFFHFISYNYAEAFLKSGEQEKARKIYHEVIRVLQSNYGLLHPQICLLYTYIADSYLLENSAEAFSYFKKAENISKKVFGKKSHTTAYIFNQLAKLHAFDNQYDSALSYIRKGIHANTIVKESYVSILENRVLLNSYQITAEIFLKRNKEGDLKNALAETLKSDSLITIIRKENYKYEDQLNLGEIVSLTYLQGIEICHQLGISGEDKQGVTYGFYLSERNKAMALVNYRNQSVLAKNSTDSVSLLVASKKLQVKKYESLLQSENLKVFPYSIKIKKLRGMAIHLRHEIDSLSGHTNTISEKSVFISTDSLSGFMDEIKTKVLGENKTLIEYTLTENTLYTFLINQDTILLKKQFLNAAFHKHFGQFRKRLLKPASLKFSKEAFKEFTNSAFQLYQYLIAPVKDEIFSKELIIVPDGILSFIPFETLISQIPENYETDFQSLDYLLKDYSITYASSATSLLNDTDNPFNIDKKKNLIGFAPSFESSNTPVYRTDTVRSNLGPLEWNTKEVQNLNLYFKTDEYLSGFATERAFKNNASGYNIIHIATHSLVDNENPMYSKIAFNKNPKDTLEDGYLHVFELFNSNIRADLVVLSACNTGYGEIKKGEGVISLGYAFAYAGVPSTIMSHWQVDDKSTYLLMDKFYAYLSEGFSKSQALRNAKLDHVNSLNTAYANPYYWGSFVAYGNDFPLVEKTSLFRVYLLIAASLVSLLILFIWLKRRHLKLEKNISPNKKLFRNPRQQKL